MTCPHVLVCLSLDFACVFILLSLQPEFLSLVQNYELSPVQPG